MKTAQRLGIKTVAVYSDHDINSKHVYMADEAVRIGPAPMNQSYVMESAIISAMKKTGAEAVHPGCGFLSLNPHFSEICEKEGFVFIGPRKSTLDLAQEKINSKKIAATTGLKSVPGYNGEVRDAKHAVEIAQDIGYPILLKAEAGIGAKGLKVCVDDNEVLKKFEKCSLKAGSLFGNPKLYIEKLLRNIKHFEIPLLVDKQGTAIAFPEIDNSIQRQNQPILLESPCVNIADQERKKLIKAAKLLVKQFGAYGLCSIEMLMDEKRNFFYLDWRGSMPYDYLLTEKLTGIDLIEQQIRIAAGHPLTLKQCDIHYKGHATSARVYAEEPNNKYQSSLGAFDQLVFPDSVDPSGGVTVESGVLKGSETSIHYKPLIGRVATTGATKKESNDKLIRALDGFVIRGVKTNVAQLRGILSHPKYQIESEVTTSFVKTHKCDSCFQLPLTTEEKERFTTAAAITDLLYRRRLVSVSETQTVKPPTEETFFVEIGKEGTLSVHLKLVSENVYEARINNRKYIVSSDWKCGETVMKTKFNKKGESIFQFFGKIADKVTMSYHGVEYELSVTNAMEKKYRDLLPKSLPPADPVTLVKATIPGRVISVLVKDKDQILQNSDICVIESMKQQSTMKAPKDAKIKKVVVKEGSIVNV